MMTMLAIGVMWAWVMATRLLVVKRSDQDLLGRLGAVALNPLASLWVLAVLRLVRVYGTVTFLQQRWTTRAAVEVQAALQSWWPGQNYVTWVGLDGYYASPSDTFSSLYGNSLTQIRSFTQDPVLLSETAVGPGTGNMTGDVMNLFQGMRQANLLGLIWFDAGGPRTRQDWRLEDHPVEMASFKHAVSEFMEPLQ